MGKWKLMCVRGVKWRGVNAAESTVLISSVILRSPFPPPQVGGYESSRLHLYIAINLRSRTTLQTNQYAFNIHPLPCVAITLLTNGHIML